MAKRNRVIDPDTMSESMKKNVISTGYVPRDHQAILHSAFKRFNVIVAHRRFGKTVGCINEMIDKAIACQLHNPHYAYIAPTYGQAEKIAWEYFKDYCSKIPGYKPNEGKLRITIKRPAQTDRMGNITKHADTITIWLLGAENPDSIRGMYMDGVILDEYGEMNPVIWTKVVRLCLADRKGWGIFIGTPKGRNSFYERYQYAQTHEDKWYHAMFKASETNILDAEEIADLSEDMTDDEVAQELECSFTSALTGLYWSKEMARLRKDGKICNVPYNPRKLVATFWDLGLADNMAVWFVQQDGEGYNVIDYIEEAGKGINWFARELKLKEYGYARHHWPHDGAQRELTTGKERWATAEELGIKPIDLVPRIKAKGDMIDAVRDILPLCKFDEENCEAGIYCLENYQRDWDAKNKVFKKQPKHNWASHGADGFGTFALGVVNRLSFSRYRIDNDLPSYAESDYNEYDGGL